MVSDKKGYAREKLKAVESSKTISRFFDLPKFLETDFARNIKTIRKDNQRARWLLILILLFFLGCLLQLFWIQIVLGPNLAQQAIKSRTFSSVIPARRGDIVDRNGNILATSIEVYDLAVNQKQVKDYVDERIYDRNGVLITSKNKQELGDARNKRVIEGYGAEAAAKRLAPILKVNPAQLGGLMVGDKGFVYLAKGIRPETYREIIQLGINGITGERRYIRAYPNGSLASSVLGFVNYEDQGLAGIELTQNKTLAGVPGKREVEISPTGQVIPGGYDINQEAKSGQSVKLTIDRDIQAVAETVLNKQLEKSGGEWGALVIQDVHTGEILALADTNNKPPYENRNSKDGFKGSRAVQYAFEPGSVGKTVTVAAALMDNKLKPTSLIPSPYSIEMNNEVIHDYAPHPVLNLSAAGVLVKSSNTGTVQIGSRISDQKRYEMMQKLGFGQRTGVELPGETPGQLRTPDKWDRRSRLVSMFGQSYSINTLQLSSVFATYGGRGVYHAPRLVMGTQTEQGVFQPSKAIPSKKVLDPNTAATLVKMMRGVVAPGTGGYIKGYWSAGKTGTAEIISPNGSLSGVVATYGVVAPADDPRIAMGIVVYKPARMLHGDPVCGPVYKEVGEFTLKRLGIPPKTAEMDIYPTVLD